jgi:DNA invertase Pin-like site-specific DNA recombinase
MLGIYCRTSKNRQEKHTIDNQRDAGILCANNLGIGYTVYIDDGISGTLDESIRDGLSDLFRDIKKGDITHVYCIDQSRIERDTRTWDFFVAECLNNDIKYYPGGSFFDLDNGTNRMFAKLMSIVNAYYAEITSKKVRLANASKVLQGKTHGLNPYGYRRGADKKYEIYPEEAEYVIKMFKMSLQGIGAYSIANEFNKLEVPTKFSGNFSGEITRKDKYTKNKTKFQKSNVKWRGNVISDMLRNKMYKGIREWNRHEDKITYENEKLVKTKVPVELIIYKDIPIIIEPEIWDAVNANLEINKKNVGRKEQYHYLLNGLVYCAHCNDEILGKKRPKGNDNSYKCKGKRPPHKNCKESRGISLSKFETFIVQHLFNSKELKKLLVDAPKNANESIVLREEKEKREKEKSEAIKAVAHFEKLLKNPNLNGVDTFINDYVNSKKKLESIERQLESLTIHISEVENHSRNKRTKSTIESYTEDVGFDVLKKLVHSLVERIEIHHTKEEKSGYFTVQIKYRFYDEYSTFITNWQALNWSWVNHYRGAAYSQYELDEDYDVEKHIANKKGVKVLPKKTFKGYSTSTMMHESIKLKPEELLKFDYPST